MHYPIVGVPILAGSVFLVPGQRGVLYALDAGTGKTIWSYLVPASVTKKETRDDHTQVTSSPIYVDGTLYVLGNDGSLSALRADALGALPPQADALTPLPGSTISKAVYPSATVTDEGSGVDPSSVSLLLDGKPLPRVTYDPSSSQVKVDRSAPDVPSAALSDGSHQVILNATDWRGNALTRSWSFTMDSNEPTPAPPTQNGADAPGGPGTGQPPPSNQ